MTETMSAHTNLDPVYPGFVNFSRLPDGKVRLLVRGDPKKHETAFICGHAADKGKFGRCTPGDENCNNYCNLAPEKGPMQDHPSACQQVICGETVELVISAEVFAALRAELIAAIPQPPNPPAVG